MKNAGVLCKKNPNKTTYTKNKIKEDACLLFNSYMNQF